MRRLRVAHFITTMERGGAEADMVRLADKLRPHGVDSVVVALRSDGPMRRDLHELGIPVLGVGDGTPVSSARRLLNVPGELRRFAPQILQGWLPHANLVATVVGACLRTPTLWKVLYTLNPALLELEKPRTLRLIRHAARWSERAAAIVYNGEAARRDHEAIGYCATKGIIIPNGFDADRFRPSSADREDVRRELKLASDVPLVGMIARWHPMKDQPVFLSAVRQLSEAGVDAHFLLIGKGNDAGNRELARFVTPDLMPRLHLLGERADIPRLIAALDVACLTSRTEGLPNVIGEAMCCAVPCVATDVGDVRHLINGTGIIVPPRDASAVANGIASILALAPDERRKLGERARARASSRDFGLSGVLDRHVELYTRLVS